MIEQLLADFFSQLDWSNLSDVDWTTVNTYLAILAASCTAIWVSLKDSLLLIWKKVEKPLGFVISSLVVWSLWLAILRTHISSTFNLDREIYDDALWISALLFTPYYLITYKLLNITVMTTVRIFEFLIDVFVFSWFENKAQANRTKWKNRLSGLVAKLEK